MARRSRRPFSPKFAPNITQLEDRITPTGGLADLPPQKPLDIEAVAGPRDDRYNPMSQAMFSQTEIMAGLRMDSPFSELAANREVAGLFDLPNSKIILTMPDGLQLAQLQLNPGTPPLVAISQLQGQPGVDWAEENTIILNGRDFTPNDPSWSNSGQYYLRLSQTDLAWDITTGLSDILVAVTDDGVGIDHPDLADSIFVNQSEANGVAGKDDDGNGFIDDVNGWDFNLGNNDPRPQGSGTHGTHVAGIIAARTNNGIGVAGTAGGNGPASSGVRILPVKWDGTNSWTAARVAASFNYLADMGAKISNASYAFDGFASNNTVKTAFEYSYSKGVLHFNSAGNNNQLNAARGVFTQTLFVSNLNSSDTRSASSNYGDFVDVAGNGSSIYSTTTNNNGTGVTYSTFSGTSMSSPHAAGAAALVWSANPTWTREQVVAQLLGTADYVDVSNPNFLHQLGTGRVNPYRALTETLPPPRLGRTVDIPLDGRPAVAPTSFSIFTPMRLDPASVKASNFELRSAGPDGVFDTADDVLVPLVINNNLAYQVGTDKLTFTRSGGGAFPTGTYRFTAFSGVDKLRDPFGSALDGDANNLPGGDYVRSFDWVANTLPSISGRAFVDWNGNGQRDAIDPNLNETPVTVFLDANHNGIRDTYSSTFTAVSGQIIPEIGRIFVPLTISDVNSPIFNVNVRVNISHPRLSDLGLFVTSPNGVRVALADNVGGNGANFTNTVFSDSATKSITAGSAPFTGTFSPQIPLALFEGVIPNGTWLLEIVDDNPAAKTGTKKVNDWSLIVTTSEEAVTTDVNGLYTFNSVAPGTYSVRALAPAGWSATVPNQFHSVTVTPTSTAPNRDFAFGRNGTLYGLTVNDKNGDGIFDAGELGLANRSILHDANNNGVFDGSGLQTFNSPNVPVAIPDNKTVTSTITVSGTEGPIRDVNVTVNLTHTYMGDLRLRLIGPGGNAVTLFDRRGGSGDNLVNTVFDDQAAKAISEGTAPFTGSFRPETPLSIFNNLDANTTWILEIADLASGDIGTLTGWSLELNNGEQTVIANAQGAFSINLPAGEQTLVLGPVAGWRPTSPPFGVMTVNVGSAPLTDRNFLTTFDTTPPQVVGVEINGGDPQRSRVTSIRVDFSELIVFPSGPAAAFQITGPQGTTGLAAIAENSGPTTSVTLSFVNNDDFGSLKDGVHTLMFVSAFAQDLAQNALATTAPIMISRLFGDLDGNGTVDSVDFAAFGSLWGQSGPNMPVDFNDNGVVDAEDFAEFGSRFGMTL